MEWNKEVIIQPRISKMTYLFFPSKWQENNLQSETSFRDKGFVYLFVYPFFLNSKRSFCATRCNPGQLKP